MIVSVSRRTDIPAFYSDWFFNRISEGYVDVINPFNSKQANRIWLDKDNVDCFVFWTKNPRPMMDKLHLLDGYNYYFQFTINGYGQDVEPKVPSKRNEVVKTFIELSNKIGKEKVIWRYDPIIISETYTVDKHISYFKYLCECLHRYTTKVVFSFVDLYKKTERNTKGLKLIEMTNEMIDKISKEFSLIAKKYGLEISTCCESVNLSKYEITHNKCIDDDLIYKISGKRVDAKKDGQREYCGCIKCTDIGAYNTCLHECKYCYANFSKNVMGKNITLHNPKSSLLIGELTDDIKIYETPKKERNLFNL